MRNDSQCLRSAQQMFLMSALIHYTNLFQAFSKMGGNNILASGDIAPLANRIMIRNGESFIQSMNSAVCARSPERRGAPRSSQRRGFVGAPGNIGLCIGVQGRIRGAVFAMAQALLLRPTATNSSKPDPKNHHIPQ